MAKFRVEGLNGMRLRLGPGCFYGDLSKIDFMKRGKIVGEPTGGSTGQPLFFDLPGGGSARVCTKRDAYPDGKEFVGVGVQPQIAARRTVADLRAGRDTVLEVALAELRKAVSR